MSFAEAVRTVFSKYATFDGRARRSEYWWWLRGLLCGVGQIIVFVMCLMDSGPDNEYGPNPKKASTA